MIKKEIKPKVTLEGLNQTVEKLATSMIKGFAHTHELIENLAISTKAGFDKVDERFDKVDERLDKVEGRLGKVENDITGIKQRLTSLDNRLDTFVDHEKRLTKVESALKIRVKH